MARTVLFEAVDVELDPDGGTLDAFGLLDYSQIVVQTTGTVAVYLQLSMDGTTWYEAGPVENGSAVNSSVHDVAFKEARLRYAANVGESVFTTETPAASVSGDYTLGTAFQSDASGLVDGIRVYVAAGSNLDEATGLLYDYASHTELARVDFTPTSDGAWNAGEFDEPVEIAAATKYVAAVFLGGVTIGKTDALFSTAGITNRHLTALPNAGNGNGRWHSGSSPAWPENAPDGNGYFVDVLFRATDVSSLTARILGRQ